MCISSPQPRWATEGCRGDLLTPPVAGQPGQAVPPRQPHRAYLDTLRTPMYLTKTPGKKQRPRSWNYRNAALPSGVFLAQGWSQVAMKMHTENKKGKKKKKAAYQAGAGLQHQFSHGKSCLSSQPPRAAAQSGAGGSPAARSATGGLCLAGRRRNRTVVTSVWGKTQNNKNTFFQLLLLACLNCKINNV